MLVLLKQPVLFELLQPKAEFFDIVALEMVEGLFVVDVDPKEFVLGANDGRADVDPAVRSALVNVQRGLAVRQNAVFQQKVAVMDSYKTLRII